MVSFEELQNMKTIDLIKIFCITALCFILTACGKTQNPSEDLPMASEESGIYLYGVRVYKLESAFSGGVEWDDIIYAKDHWDFYDNHYVDYPSKTIPRIIIDGTEYRGTTYTNSEWKKVDRIRIYGAPMMKDFDIPINQGEYEAGSHPDVASVTFNKFFKTTVKGRYNSENWDCYELADIDIRIILNNGNIIDIIYDGPQPWDGRI